MKSAQEVVSCLWKEEIQVEYRWGRRGRRGGRVNCREGDEEGEEGGGKSVGELGGKG